MQKLIKYGWDSFFEEQLSLEDNIKDIAKIITATKKGFIGITEDKEVRCLTKGSLMHHKIYDESLLPKVGDFVVLENKNNQELKSYFIKKILLRKNELKRKIVGKKVEDQIIATNLDYAFITISADQQFNIKRIQRMVIACYDANIKPVLILTKTDINPDYMSFKNELNDMFKDIIIITSSYNNQNAKIQLQEVLKNDKSAVFIGSSGAGKSTLTNMLLEEDRQKVNEISIDKDKGKHTTTHREIFLLKTGGLVIDNPGIKEFGLWLDDGDSINSGFEHIAEAIKGCKFSDCTHSNEPGCKVQELLQSKQINIEDIQSYIKLQEENKADSIRKNDHEKRKNDKKFTKNANKIKQFKYNDKQ